MQAARWPVKPCSSATTSKRSQSTDPSKPVSRGGSCAGEAHSSSTYHSLLNEALPDKGEDDISSDIAMLASVDDGTGSFAWDAGGKSWRAAVSYFPIDADNVSSPRLRRRISIPRSMIF